MTSSRVGLEVELTTDKSYLSTSVGSNLHLVWCIDRPKNQKVFIAIPSAGRRGRKDLQYMLRR